MSLRIGCEKTWGSSWTTLSVEGTGPVFSEPRLDMVTYTGELNGGPEDR